MSLAFYDSDQVAFGSGVMREFFDGRRGMVKEQLFYLKNSSTGHYYTDVMVQPQINSGSWDSFSDTGWSIKVMPGQTRPTEAEWDTVVSGASVEMDDIGDSSLADTDYHPIWVRMFCPGGTPSQIRDDVRLNTSYVKRLLGT